MEDKIFVSIASYRDDDCINTINDLFSKAKHPENLVIGLCLQHDGSQILKFDENIRKQIKIIDLHFTHSYGVCWVRSLIQSLYNNEKYYFQIDSHMRFVKDWDIKLIEILNNVSINNKKSILSTYPLSFTPPDDFQEDGLVIIKPNKFDESGLLTLNSGIHVFDENNKNPFVVYFISAGFLFSFGEIINDMPYDPNLYFIGEEITFALRCFTKGWDIYNPACVIAYHNYNQNTNRTRHWEDYKEWYKINENSIKRFNKLFDKNRDLINDSLGKYDIGTKRTVDEFEKLINVDFTNKKINL
ncbi:MAG: GlcNAc-transferase family protein [Nanoarchaeota archaeon]